VPAWHTSTTPRGTANVPAGLVVGLGGKVVYHLGDTALFSDLRLVGERDAVDVALMCIGGHYTMDRIDAVKAAELVGAKTVIPCHYNTFPPVETDAAAFKSDVESKTSSKVEVLEPGESFSA
jgi:L-ascorbate metabolism protein UlaG (beta-lactamase superfamily)